MPLRYWLLKLRRTRNHVIQNEQLSAKHSSFNSGLVLDDYLNGVGGRESSVVTNRNYGG